MTKLTPEREKDIRQFATTDEKILLSEIDVLRTELKDMSWEYKNCCNFANDFEEQIFHLKKERDQLKAENEKWNELYTVICELNGFEINPQNKTLGIAASYSLLQIVNKELREENTTLRHEFKMAQASMPEVKRVRERVAKLREALQKIHNPDFWKTIGSDAIIDVADRALVQDDEYSRMGINDEKSDNHSDNVPERVNFGHGHVRTRPDGALARCGGPMLCNECAKEKAELEKRG